MAPTSRTVAATALTEVIANGKTFDSVLKISLERLPDLRDRSFAQELIYGVLRWYWNLLPQLKQLLRRPLRQRDRDIEMLLLIGLYQLRYLSTPTHAAVAATVSACDGLNKTWAKGLINATLRNAIRHEGDLAAAAMESISARTAHPQWFITAVQRDWPEDWQSILAANNEHPPFTLRVNQQLHRRDEYLDLLRN
ncbi:MAG: transcription antitermination factor NusB, partial [Gammaproteobacteria bacterium]